MSNRVLAIIFFQMSIFIKYNYLTLIMTYNLAESTKSIRMFECFIAPFYGQPLKICMHEGAKAAGKIFQSFCFKNSPKNQGTHFFQKISTFE